LWQEKISTVAGAILATNPLPLAAPRSARCYFRARLDRRSSGDHFSLCAMGLRISVPLGAEGESGTMRRINSLLRAAPRRIGRRLAAIVAIAAASLASAGA
jgi:hypothetical protein